MLDEPNNLLDKPAVKSRVMRVFKSRIGTCNYPFASSGKLAHFIRGEYLTDLPNEINELESEIRQGHPHIYIDEKKREIDILADPLDGVRKKAIADYIAEQDEAKRKALGKELGDTEVGKVAGNVGIGTTANAGTGAATTPAGAKLITPAQKPAEGIGDTAKTAITMNAKLAEMAAAAKAKAEASQTDSTDKV